MQRVMLVGPDGVPVMARYLMQRQPDGSWLINGCILEKPPTRRHERPDARGRVRLLRRPLRPLHEPARGRDPPRGVRAGPRPDRLAVRGRAGGDRVPSFGSGPRDGCSTSPAAPVARRWTSPSGQGATWSGSTSSRPASRGRRSGRGARAGDRAEFRAADCGGPLPSPTRRSTPCCASTRSTTCRTGLGSCASGPACCARAGGCCSPTRWC